jgi:osmotically-inducible protein OsmY
MEYARAEMRFASGIGPRPLLFAGLVEGSVRGIVVEPDSLTVTHTLVSSGQAKKLGPSRRPISDQSTVAQGAITLMVGLSLMSEGGRMGTIPAVWCDRASGQIMDVLVARGGGFMRAAVEHIVPASAILGVGQGRLVLSKDAPPAGTWPPYRADAQLTRDIREALARPISPLAARHIHVDVHDGQVHLSGALDTQAEADLAARAARGVIGVRSLVNDLIAHESLASRVEQRLSALDEDGNSESVPGPHVRVLAEHGIIYLDGTVPTGDVRSSLESAARSVTGVHVVLNRLEVKKDA